MALLFFDGFDAYSTYNDVALAYPFSSVINGSFNTTAGRYGGAAFETWNSQLTASLPAVNTNIWVGFAFLNTDTYPLNDTTLLRFSSASGVEGSIFFQASTGILMAYRGDSVTLLGQTAISSVPFNVWTWLEFHYVFDGSAGIIEIWIDGIRVLNLTGINTKQNIGETGLTRFSVGCDRFTARFIDDLYCLDTTGSLPTNARLGDSRVFLQQPNSDAGPNNGTPTPAGSHYAAVDGIHGYNPADYITMVNTTGQEEKYGVASLPSSPPLIFGVTLTSVADKSDAGVASQHNKVTSGASSANGTSNVVSTSYNFKRDLFTIDPNTGLAWTVAAVNAMKIGIVVE